MHSGPRVLAEGCSPEQEPLRPPLKPRTVARPEPRGAQEGLETLPSSPCRRGPQVQPTTARRERKGQGPDAQLPGAGAMLNLLKDGWNSPNVWDP